jgi:hypothetical protein
MEKSSLSSFYPVNTVEDGRWGFSFTRALQEKTRGVVCIDAIIGACIQHTKGKEHF